MKTIKSAILGSKSIPDDHFDEELRKILREQRTVILTRMLSELTTYIDYKFQIKPTHYVMDKIRERLTALKESFVSLTSYQATYEMVRTRQLIVLSSDEFYKEIDGEITPYVTQQQLDLKNAEAKAA